MRNSKQFKEMHHTAKSYHYKNSTKTNRVMLKRTITLKCSHLLAEELTSMSQVKELDQVSPQSHCSQLCLCSGELKGDVPKNK